jgi:hypothetical protein
MQALRLGRTAEPIGAPERLTRMKLSERQLTIGIISCTGLIILALQCVAPPLLIFDSAFGPLWMSRVRHGLIDLGVPTHFVTHHAVFLLLHVPDWCVLIVMAFCLGLNTRRLAKIAAFSFIIWLPVMDFVLSIWYHFADGGTWPDATKKAVLFGFNVRILPAALTLLFGFAAWSLGRRLNRRKQPGHCLRCDYNLTGNVSGICPECGTTVPAGITAAVNEGSGRPE